MAKKYIVDLSKDEKTELVSLTQRGRTGARKIKRANIDGRFTIPNARDKLKNLYPVREEQN
jgi:hypothetical protein